MNTLTDRYLAATLRTVPAARREEIATELRTAIEDMIDDRVGGGQDGATAEREVLTELGHPERLAARYADRRLQLIGPTYYLTWQQVLRRLLITIPGIVGVIVGVVQATVADDPTGAIGAGISAAFQAAVQIAFWVTLSFAILERTNTSLPLPEWNVDQLPETPAERDIRLPDTCASVAMVLFTLAFLPWQHFRSWVRDTDGERIPLLDPALWTSWLPVLAAVLLAGLVLEVVKYRTGRWTWPLVVANALLDLAFTVPLIWLVLTDRLLNPELVDRFGWLRDGDGLGVTGRITVVVIAAITLWDLADSALKARRSAARTSG
ncbi:permease prefix domain 1-containing protein [Micromonospora sp. WMMD987]|uniref:permease prefix domain 1-containing protein n=1 Tax=Micromonospora sp. WMMD987 TaxID=3016089 RepID=UPI00249C7578|nr:permease prefix domain 1-containing protein [Micromonospora sp. WMMD987]WFE93708.1 permease prefix domain 1-containing protein [Micromonospora sp. WMMD987]